MNDQLENKDSSNDSEAENTYASRLITLQGNLSESAFALKCNIPLSSMRKYLSGSVPGTDKTVQIAKATGVSLVWLATGEGPMHVPALQREAEEEMVRDVLLGDEEAAKARQERFRATMDLVNSAKSEGRQAALDDFAVVPVYDVRASAGYGAAIDDEKVVTQIAFRRDWLAGEGLHIKGLAAVTADGDSMEPTIADGSLLLVDTQQREVAGAHIYVLRLDGHIYAKRLQRLHDGSVRISSDNKAYSDEVVGRDDAPNLDILGRVVWIGRRA